MTNENFKPLASQIFETVEDEEFFICSLHGIDCLVLNVNGNMYLEFLNYYANRSLLKIMWEIKLPVQAIREHVAIGKLTKILIFA